MLDQFEAWFMRNAPRLRDNGLQVAVTRPEAKTDKSSAYADIDTEGHVARVTVWDTGECDWEAIDRRTEETVLSEHSVIQAPETLDSALDEFCGRLALKDFPLHG